MVSVLLALAASLSWGVSDFLGGLNSRHLAIPAVLLVSQTVGLLLLLPLTLVHGWPAFDAPSYGFAMAGSAAGLIGIAGMYRGMAVGSVSIIAPISATGAALPVLFGLLRGERGTPLQTVGMGLALLGIVLASRAAGGPDSSGSARLARGVGFAVVGALGFGGFFVLIHQASTYDVLWAGTIQRLTGVCIMLVIVLVQRPSLAVGWPRLPGLAVIGTLDTAANVLYGLASGPRPPRASLGQSGHRGRLRSGGRRLDRPAVVKSL
ncbi:MAG: EamA family transporter [Chloroflexi bacterium]|nr:EamA family transporter [Chloroflexota bacterium]